MLLFHYDQIPSKTEATWEGALIWDHSLEGRVHHSRVGMESEPTDFCGSGNMRWVVKSHQPGSAELRQEGGQATILKGLPQPSPAMRAHQRVHCLPKEGQKLMSKHLSSKSHWGGFHVEILEVCLSAYRLGFLCEWPVCIFCLFFFSNGFSYWLQRLIKAFIYAGSVSVWFGACTITFYLTTAFYFFNLIKFVKSLSVVCVLS